MGIKTSVYLSDSLNAQFRASGLPLAEIVRRGLDAAPPDERLARLTAAEAAEGIREDLREIVRAAVSSALRDARGESW